MSQVGRGPDRMADEPVGELIKQASEQISRLLRDEMRLARAELAGKGKRAGIGAGLFGGAGMVGFYGAAAILAAAVLALALVLPAWAAALIVGVGLLAVAAAVALVGKRQIAQANPPVPDQATASVKADVAEIRERAKR
ncbi:MAG TPA: phage holin family protein [Streptosporangiaceae bacterium]|nr:phage holin family protein [Streptosporangiaceae bacterium]